MLLAAVAAAVALGAEPQCPERIDQRSCVAGYDGGRLSLALAPAGGALSPAEAANVLCRPETQAHRDACQATCALQLVVLRPAQYAFSACARDNVFAPYARAGHVDEAHPLRRRELPLVYVGGGGCDPASWSRGKHEGKIAVVLIPEGSCTFAARQALAGGVGVGALIYGSFTSNMYKMPLMDGPSTFATMPALVISSQHGGLIREAMFDKGLPVSGYLDLACDASPATPPPTLPVTDNCPSLSLVGKCSNQADPEHRLCNRCPQQLSWGGKSVCLWGNGLVPRDGRNHLKSVLSLPADVTAVYIESSTRIGCSPGEFAGLAGTVVFAEHSPRVFRAPRCPPFISARNAEAEGVTAFVSITGREGVVEDVSGPAEFLSIPVHTTLPSDYDALRAMFHAGTKEDHLPGKPRYVLRNARIVDEAVVDPYRPASVTEAKGPVVVVLDELPAFDWTPAVIVSLVVIAVMAVLIAWKLHQQHRLPAESVGSTFTVPLSVASMGLSISLVFVIAAVAFSLAHTAGQSATDTALDDGHAATMQTYFSAQDNVQDQSRQISKLATGAVSWQSC